MKVFVIIFLIFSSACVSQNHQIDTIRYEYYNSTLASPLLVEITYRDDFKRSRAKILKHSYIGNIKWLVPKKGLVWAEKDINLHFTKKQLKKIIEQAQKIEPDKIMPDWEYDKEGIILDGDSSELYFSNWFEDNNPLKLNFSNTWSDTEKRGLSQYNKVIELIEKIIMY